MTTKRLFSAPASSTFPNDPLFYTIGSCPNAQGNHFHISFRAQALALLAQANLLMEILNNKVPALTEALIKDLVSIVAVYTAHMTTIAEEEIAKASSPKVRDQMARSLAALFEFVHKVLEKAEKAGYSLEVTEMTVSDEPVSDITVTRH